MKPYRPMWSLVSYTRLMYLLQKAKIRNRELHIYLVPHQDDETLTQAISILNNIRLGNEVFLVLVTDGAATKVGIELGLSAEEITEARNNEFLEACKCLGLTSSRILTWGLRDGKVSKEEVLKKIEEMNLPQDRHIVFHTMSVLDTHHDHRQIALAGEELRKAGYQVQEHLSTRMCRTESVLDQLKEEEVSVYKLMAEEDQQKLIAAVQCYYTEDEEKNRYGIGGKSVPQEFESLIQEPYAANLVVSKRS
ncbi:PIG-L deacetylase family protein [Risungbinella massiliensis]|uniref:PIG-L deacetylase family protein n=1 Tax=Risungbinella massiliensis TaxID=1329796 RepID=UPI0011C72DBF|nr:PIG-L family deacetylase [Risungbinella massiliensis]